MPSALLMLLLAVFLTGAALGVFLLLLVGIHVEEHRMSLTGTPSSKMTASTRRFLGVTVRHQSHETTRKPAGLKR